MSHLLFFSVHLLLNLMWHRLFAGIWWLCECKTTALTTTNEKKILRSRGQRYVSERSSGRRKKTAHYVWRSFEYFLFAAATRCSGERRNIVWHSYNLLAIVLCANILSEMFKPHRFQFNATFCFVHRSFPYAPLCTLFSAYSVKVHRLLAYAMNDLAAATASGKYKSHRLARQTTIIHNDHLKMA